MSLLDDIRPAAKKPRPSELGVQGSQLSITWADDRRTLVSLRFLRQRCPCAGCVDEWSGQRTLDPASVPEDIKAVKLTPIGRYAVQIGWSDGHGAGIYSWELLDRLAREQPRGAA